MADDILAELVSSLGATRSPLVAIDGQHGVGKTTLARELGRRLGVRCVHLDEHLERGRSEFLAALRWNQLAEALREKPLIVEGVCMLAVLEHLGIACDQLVYVQESSPGTREALDRGPLGKEVASYHQRFHPEREAQFLYVRQDEGHRSSNMHGENPQVDIAYIASRTKFAIVLAIGGMLTLFVGLAVLLYGAASADATTIKLAGMELSASGIGAVIMGTSSVWAFFAYKARPQYARQSHRVEEYDDKRQLVRREDRESSTQATVEREQ